jgi:carbonic anhydrase
VNVTAAEALERLREGNRRFVSGRRSVEATLSHTRRADLATAQRPFAIVLGCSDSRVPAEIVFDQGLGDLFVIRVAGNIVAPSQVGSVEFAAERFGTRLVVVLGHTQCGAVLATLEDVRRAGRLESPAPSPAPGSRPALSLQPNLQSIVNRIRPSVEQVLASLDGADDPRIVREAGRANVRAAVDHLRHGSPLLERLIHEGLAIVGAEYSLDTGEVDFFDA